MNSKNFSEAMNELDSKYVDEAINYKKKVKQSVWIRWGAMAACLCLLIVGGVMFTHNNSNIPNPELVQIPNPIITVTTVEEMEKYLDFTVPVLEKEVESYSVIVMDSYPSIGQVDYADGSEFRIQYGNGDISGIYGGTLEESSEIDGVNVEYYKYTDSSTNSDITYAIWEQNHFTFSYIYTGGNKADVETFIQQCK